MTGPLVTAPTSVFCLAGDALSPAYLNGPNWRKYRWSINILYDDLSDGATWAVKSRFPSTAPPDAFPWIAVDRTISQGYQEPQADYVARLQQWLDLLPYEGHPTGMLLGLIGQMLPSAVTVRTVDNSSNWYGYSAGDDPIPLAPVSASRASYPSAYPAGLPVVPPPTFVQPGQSPHTNWDWDSLGYPFGAAYRWWRLWPIIYSTSGSPYPVPSATWGGGQAWGSGAVWGWGGTASQSSALAAEVKQQKAANVTAQLIVSYDPNYFNPALAFGSPYLPNGTWGTFGKVVSDPVYGQVYTATRPSCATATIFSGVS
jgi:hypothetical protein